MVDKRLNPAAGMGVGLAGETVEAASMSPNGAGAVSFSEFILRRFCKSYAVMVTLYAWRRAARAYRTTDAIESPGEL